MSICKARIILQPFARIVHIGGNVQKYTIDDAMPNVAWLQDLRFPIHVCMHIRIKLQTSWIYSYYIALATYLRELTLPIPPRAQLVYRVRAAATAAAAAELTGKNVHFLKKTNRWNVLELLSNVCSHSSVGSTVQYIVVAVHTSISDVAVLNSRLYLFLGKDVITQLL